MLPRIVQDWERQGRHIEAGGHRLFTIDFQGGDGRPTLILHGFPSSSHDFHRAVPFLGDRPVYLFDMLGYGLSDKPADHSYSLFEQADFVELFARERGLDEVDLVAHDMGTSVACELLARRERGLLSFRVASVLLMNGSVHIELAKLTRGQRILETRLGKFVIKMASYPRFRKQFPGILGRPLQEEDYEAMWALGEHNDGRLRLPQIIHYLGERRRFGHRWIGPLTRLDIPAHILWGTKDPVAVFRIAEQLASEIPGATLDKLEGLGHYPQLEDPERTAKAIRRFLDAQTPNTA